MLNAEDTKERIRKLRLKVVSGPIDPMVEDNFKENIVESTKITTGWNDTAGSENAGQNKIKKNNFIKNNVEKALVSLSQKKSKKFQDQNDTKNLNSNMFSQSTIQNEIDNRITNNSKLIIELFNERIEDLKSKIVNTDNFDDFRNRIAKQLEISITQISEKLNEKIIEIRKQTDENDKELNNLINKKSLELLNTTKEKINLFSDRLNVYDNKFPETTKKLEEKGVNIWKGNTSTQFLNQMNLNYDEGMMGPMYGYQWRFYNKPYAQKSEDKGIDQLKNCINLIKNDPTNRRIFKRPK